MPHGAAAEKAVGFSGHREKGCSDKNLGAWSGRRGPAIARLRPPRAPAARPPRERPRLLGCCAARPPGGVRGWRRSLGKPGAGPRPSPGKRSCWAWRRHGEGGGATRRDETKHQAPNIITHVSVHSEGSLVHV